VVYPKPSHLSPAQFGFEEETPEDREARLARVRSANDFDLPPEKDAFYAAARAGQEHRDRMAAMSVQERHEYLRGLREGLKDGDRPKQGDLDNPLKKDMPKEPKAQRAPAAPRPVDPMVKIRKIQSLARKAKGRRR